jgi:hypothetical protein
MGGGISINKNAKVVHGDQNPSKVLIGTESKSCLDVDEKSVNGRIESSTPAASSGNVPAISRINLIQDAASSSSSQNMRDTHEFQASAHSSRSNNQSQMYPSSLTRHAIEGQRGENDIENEMFDQTAMSLEMDREDLIFNLLYFGGGDMSNINTALSNAREETVALHSENNTPYKLRPAPTTAIEGLKSESLLHLDELDSIDCSICKDDMEVGVQVVFLPNCAHCFHKECLIRWIKLQGFCPVCRATIVGETAEKVSCDIELQELLQELQTPRVDAVCHELLEGIEGREVFLNQIQPPKLSMTRSMKSDEFGEERRDSQLEAFLEDMGISNAIEDVEAECIEGYHYSADEDDTILDQSDARLDSHADKKSFDDSYYDAKKADENDDSVMEIEVNVDAK